jgi:hypothetical protein
MPSSPRAENYVVLNYNQESSETEQFNPNVPPETRGAVTIVRYQDIAAATETVTDTGGNIVKTLQVDSDNVLAAVGQNDEGQPEWQRLLTAQGKQVIDGGLDVGVITLATDGGIIGTNNNTIVINDIDVINGLITGIKETYSAGPPPSSSQASTFVLDADTGDAWFKGALEVTGNTTLGNTGTDTVTISGALSVDGKISNPGATNVFDDNVKVEGNLAVDGDTTLGNASGDTTTINGRLNAADHRIVELYASSDTVGSTIDTTAAQTLFTNHQWNVPANTITRGSVARLRAWGSYGVTGTPTLTIRLKCAAAGSLVAGSTTLLNFGAATLSAAGIWILDATMRYGSSGSTTSQYWSGTLFLGANSGAAVATRMAIDGTDLALSSNRDFGITAQWSASSASNTITFDRYVFETSSI